VNCNGRKIYISLDLAIGKIKAACEEKGYVLFITADHGNAEKMYSEQGGPHTAHTTYRGMNSVCQVIVPAISSREVSVVAS
jgi:bisphosphoglycerate-independent phosphoglycerate mutase (AlkP superfamily)